MKNPDELKKLLEGIQDTYEDFVLDVMCSAKNDTDREKIANFIEGQEHPDTSSILNYVSDEIDHIPKFNS